MGRPVTVAVGPLVAASATKIALSQKAAIAGTNYLVLNGGSGVFTANNICQSQSPGGAVALTLNGTTVAGGVAYMPSQPVPCNIYITSAANDSARTFTVVGTVYAGNGIGLAVTEVITGADTSTVSSVKKYNTITSITISGASAGALTVGTYEALTLDTGRRVLFTSAGNDSGISFGLTGTDWNGNPVSETVAGANATTASSVLDYNTITNITTTGAIATTVTVGTSGVAGSPWIDFDELATQGPVSIQVSVTGTINFTVQQTLMSTTNADAVAKSAVVWVNHPDSALTAATATAQGNYAYQPAMARVVVNSGTGSVSATFIQAFLG